MSAADDVAVDTAQPAEPGRASRPLYGLMAEFTTADALLAAARKAHDAGYAQVEAYAPFHIEGLDEAVGFTRTRVPLLTLLAAIVGGAGGYFMQWYAAVIDYPVNVGGRTQHAWPMFIPVSFSLCVLAAAVAAVLTFILGSGLPRLNHPVFDAPDFDLASRNRFFLCLRCDDPAFDADRAGVLLDSMQPLRRMEVPA